MDIVWLILFLGFWASASVAVCRWWLPVVDPEGFRWAPMLAVLVVLGPIGCMYGFIIAYTEDGIVEVLKHLWYADVDYHYWRELRRTQQKRLEDKDEEEANTGALQMYNQWWALK